MNFEITEKLGYRGRYFHGIYKTSVGDGASTVITFTDEYFPK